MIALIYRFDCVYYVWIVGNDCVVLECICIYSGSGSHAETFECCFSCVKFLKEIRKGCMGKWGDPQKHYTKCDPWLYMLYGQKCTSCLISLRPIRVTYSIMFLWTSPNQFSAIYALSYCHSTVSTVTKTSTTNK